MAGRSSWHHCPVRPQRAAHSTISPRNAYAAALSFPMISGYDVIFMTMPSPAAAVHRPSVYGSRGNASAGASRRVAAHHWRPAGALALVAAAVSGGRHGAITGADTRQPPTQVQ